MGKEAKAVDETLSLTVGGNVADVFKSNYLEFAMNDYYLKATNVCIEATSNITLKVYGAYITIGAGGIKAGSSGMIIVEAGGILTLKGNLVKIN